MIPHAALAHVLLKKGIIFLPRGLFLPHSQISAPWKEQESPLSTTFKNGSLRAQFGKGLKKAAAFQTQAAHTALGYSTITVSSSKHVETHLEHVPPREITVLTPCPSLQELPGLVFKTMLGK